MKFTVDVFAKAAGINQDAASKMYPGLVKAMVQGQLNTPLRLAMFIAQCGHESVGFKYWTELGDRKYFDKYDNRKDLGNVGKGSGYKWRGRSPIQLTGATNYRSFTTWANKRGVNIDFEKDPDKVAEYEYGWLAAVFFWSTRRLNEPADKGMINRCTRLINGGFNGLVDRKKRYDHALNVLRNVDLSDIYVPVPVAPVVPTPIVDNSTVGRLIEFNGKVYYVDKLEGRLMASKVDVDGLVTKGYGPVGVGSDALRAALVVK